MGNDFGLGPTKSVLCLLAYFETTISLIKFLYWTSDQKAIRLNNVGHNII